MSSLIKKAFIGQSLLEEGTRYLRNQSLAMQSKLNFHTGNILSQRKMSVSVSGQSSGVLTINHTAYERFLDMNIRKDGKVVRKGFSIHNRFMYGHFASLRDRVMYGFTDEAIAQIKNELNTQQ